jgi:hypothetical protein
MEILRYLNWVWRSWELWQKTFVVAMILNLSSLLAPAPYNQYLLMAGILPLFLWTGKWWIWDRAIESYKEYKKQRDGLFDTIKGK